MRPEELVLLNASDIILLGGIPGAKIKEPRENITQKVFTWYCRLKVKQAAVPNQSLKSTDMSK